MSHIQHLDAEGRQLPSVSAIPAIFAKDMSGFEDWICRGLHDKSASCCTKAKRDYYQEAANLGNDIHELREGYLRGTPFVEGVPDYQAKVFKPVADFYKSSGYKPLKLNDGTFGVELKMTGKEFGGTLDGAGTFSVPFWEKQRSTFWSKETRTFIESSRGYEPNTDAIWIEDLKIKSKLDSLHSLQLYGYSLLLKEIYDIDANWGLIIRREKTLGKCPELQLRGYYLPAYKEYWDASIKMWGFLNAK